MLVLARRGLVGALAGYQKPVLICFPPRASRRGINQAILVYFQTCGLTQGDPRYCSTRQRFAEARCTLSIFVYCQVCFCAACFGNVKGIKESQILKYEIGHTTTKTMCVPLCSAPGDAHLGVLAGLGSERCQARRHGVLHPPRGTEVPDLQKHKQRQPCQM